MYKELEDIDLSEDIIENELRIDYSSIFAIEKELAEHSIQESKYIRYAALANKQIAELELTKSVTIAEIVEEIKNKAIEKKKPIPPSAIGELRKSDVPLDKRYKKICQKLANAYEIAEILNGLVKSWNNRGYRLNMIAQLNKDDKYSFHSDMESIDKKLEY